MRKYHQKAFFTLSMILAVASVTINVTAQERPNRNNDERRQPSTRNNRPQQNFRPAPRQQQPVNRPQVNRPQVRNYSNNPGYRPQGWAATRRPYRRPPVVYNGKRYYAYHPYFPHRYTAFYYGPRWHPIGFFLSSLVSTAIIIDFENRHYHYDDGVFYAPYNNGYQVVPAPYGAYVPSIPDGYQQLAVGGQTYYYFGGAFFVLNGNSYEVVQAPAGAVVYNLPQGALNVQVDSYTYLQYNGTYYQPIQINGQDAYEVVQIENDSQP